MKESTARMEIQLSRPTIMSSSSSSSSSSNRNATHNETPNASHGENPNNRHHHHDSSSNNTANPMQLWWESISKARARIQALSSILPPSSSPAFSALADSDRPARSLLDSPEASHAISAPLCGSGDDPLCHWLYDTFLTGDPDLRLVVLSFIPLLAGPLPLPRYLWRACRSVARRI